MILTSMLDCNNNLFELQCFGSLTSRKKQAPNTLESYKLKETGGDQMAASILWFLDVFSYFVSKKWPEIYVLK